MQLFDLEADPGERTNLAEEHPVEVARLTKLLRSYVQQGRSTPGAPQTNEGTVEFLPKPYPAQDAATSDKYDVVYKTVNEAALKMHVYRPRKPAVPAAAIVFFFGGGWKNGSPDQFFAHCEHLAARGMVAISAEYRVKSRHGATPFDCVADARSAIRYRARARGAAWR